MSHFALPHEVFPVRSTILGLHRQGKSRAYEESPSVFRDVPFFQTGCVWSISGAKPSSRPEDESAPCASRCRPPRQLYAKLAVWPDGPGSPLVYYRPRVRKTRFPWMKEGLDGPVLSLCHGHCRIGRLRNLPANSGT